VLELLLAVPPRRSGDAHLGTKNVYASKLPRAGSTNTRSAP
jgi:hypothetical protein